MDRITKESIDEIILSTAFNMASSGESKKNIIEAIVKMGWDRERAELAVKEIFKFMPSSSEGRKPFFIALIPAILTVAVLIFVYGDSFFVMPALTGWRVLASMGYTLGVPLVLLILWLFFYVLIER